MTPTEPGRRIATGRAADVFDLDDGTVLRRYRKAYDSEPEARLMRWLHDQGYPVPLTHSASGPDLVMDRVDGPTMFEDLIRHPWRLGAHARLLAELQRTLGGLPAPDWLRSTAGVPEGASLLHLDLHPLNVIMSSKGPVVIDWTNASRGPAGYDVAMTYIVLSTSDVPRLYQRVARTLFVRAFAGSRGPVFTDFLDAAASARLLDPNVTSDERARIQKNLPRAR